MDRAEKKQAVAALNEVFAKTQVVVVAHYSGLSVAQLQNLRKQARNAMKKIREGKAETEDVAALRSELERLKSEQKLLRDRIEVLEKHAP